jgi:hypothetical protein
MHLPLWVFYVLLIGGGIVGLLVRRRWKRVLPGEREPTPDVDRLDTLAGRRVAKIFLVRYAFRAVPQLVAVAAAIWFGIFQNPGSRTPFIVAIVFAIAWSIVWQPLWQGLVLPFVRRR